MNRGTQAALHLSSQILLDAQLCQNKLDGEAPMVADQPNATPPLCLVGCSANTEIYGLTGAVYLPSPVKLP